MFSGCEEKGKSSLKTKERGRKLKQAARDDQKMVRVPVSILIRRRMRKRKMQYMQVIRKNFPIRLRLWPVTKRSAHPPDR